MRSAVIATLLCAAAPLAQAGWYQGPPEGLAYGMESLSDGWGPENVTQHSGYVAVGRDGAVPGHLFFWMFESRNDPKTDPLVIWLTGGPGCSSELAIFEEQGPYRLSKDGTVSTNNYAWNSVANVIFVDQPVGTGFSYAEGSYVKSEAQVAADMWDMIQTLLAQFPQYKDLDFFVTGESYAGHYVPAISNAILQNNKNLSAGETKVNMRGLAIGNGLVDPKIQYTQYAPFAYDNKLVTESQYQALNETTQKCESAIKQGSPFALYTCNQLISMIGQDDGGKNVYDIRIPCRKPPLCYDFSAVDNLMGQASVQKSLGVDPSKSSWSECNNQVHSAMMGDWMTNLEQPIPDLLAADYKVLVYSGEEDLICNWYGGRAWVSAMQWPGQAAYNKQSFSEWSVDGKKAGEFITQDNLTFLGVYAAGHMVPKDQPKAALAMFTHFINSKPFVADAAAEDAAVAVA